MNQESDVSTPQVLADKTIVVTRSLAQARNLSDALERYGASIIEFPTIDIKLLIDDIPTTMDNVDWIVFTSANAVRGLHASAKTENLKLRFPKSKICCVGPATEVVAQKAGLNVDLLPDVYTAGNVYAALLEVEDGAEPAKAPCATSFWRQGLRASLEVHGQLTRSGRVLTVPRNAGNFQKSITFASIWS